MMKLGRNDLCWCGSGLKYKKCHSSFDEKIEEYRLKGAIVPDRELLKTKEQIEGIKASAKINIEILDYVAEHIKAGVTTEEIDQWVYDITVKNGAIPAKFELATPNLSELVDLSWAVISSNSDKINTLYIRYDEELCAYKNNADYIKVLESKLDEKRDIDNKRLLINALNAAKVIVRNLEIIDTLLEEE